jgi:hypothetical protein
MYKFLFSNSDYTVLSVDLLASVCKWRCEVGSYGFTPAQVLLHGHAPHGHAHHSLRLAHGDATAPHHPEWFHAPSLQLRSCSTATPITACALLIVIQKQPYVTFSRAAAQQCPSPRLSFFHREIQQWQFLFQKTVPHFHSTIANSGLCAKNTMVFVEF